MLKKEDPEAARIIQKAMVRDGVSVETGVSVAKVVPEASGGTVHLNDGRAFPFDALLMAIGRAPRTSGIGLDLAGVKQDHKGYIEVDAHLRTSQPLIWAAGDVTNVSHYTHTAGVHGSLAASNAILGVLRRINLTAVPRVTYTSPELAAVGMSTDQSSCPPGYRIVTGEHAEVDRAVTERQTAGFSRLVIDRKGRIVGATVVGPRAGETIGEMTLAIHQRLRPRDVAGTIHAYPTYNDGVWHAAVTDVRRQLSRGLTGMALGLLRHARGRWVEWRQSQNR